jgi:biotin carboxylase
LGETDTALEPSAGPLRLATLDRAEFRGKRLLFLPGGQWQVPVIRIAQAMGFHVVCADGTPHAPGFEVADEAVRMPLQDIDGLVELGRSRGVHAVMTEQTDFAVPIVARVAERLGLRGLPVPVADAVTNKGLMRQRAEAAGIRQPRFRVCRNSEEARAAVKDLGLPLFYKPLDAQSSRGVGCLVDAEPRHIDDAFATAAACSSTGGAIFETCLTGIECTVEGFVVDGEPHTLAISDKEHFPNLPGVAKTLTYPAAFPREVLDRIARAHEAVVRAMGIPFGITHAEFMVDADGLPWLVEIAARGGGSRIPTHIVPAVCGFHPTPALLRLLMGWVVTVQRSCARGAELRFLTFPAGKRFEGFSNLSEVRNLPGVIEIFSNYLPGERIGGIEDDRSRHGFVITAGADRDEARALAQYVEHSLHVAVKG